MAAQLASSGFNTLTLDMRGMGESAGSARRSPEERGPGRGYGDGFGPAASRCVAEPGASRCTADRRESVLYGLCQPLGA